MTSQSAPSHLPIQHPDYRYSDCSNPYAKKLSSSAELKIPAYSDNRTELYRGSWRAQFPDGRSAPDRELHVEIGCNAGHVCVEWAARNAEAAYIGIDWKFKPIFRAAEKAVKRNIGNLIFLRAHAERLEYMFAPGEIDRLYLFFPDPWPKKAHWKNRFVTAEQLLRIRPLLKTGGIFHIKTDHPGYFEWMEAAIAEAGSRSPGWEVLDRTADLHADHPCPSQLQIPDVTLFERLFIKDGIKIHSVKLRKL